MSRVDAIQERSSNLCSYEYLGLSTFIQVTYDAAGSLKLTYSNGGTGDAGDQYTGLDVLRHIHTENIAAIRIQG